MGRIICIANRKGGVGKTTTAINLAASLATNGEPTLLIDCDPQGNATSGIGIKVEADTPTIYDALLGACPLEEVKHTTAITQLAALPANHDLIGAEVELLNTKQREYQLQSLLRPYREQYRYLLIDCPPSLGLLTVNALTAADSVLIPVQCEYYALEGLRSLLETLTLIRERLNPDLAIEGILLTMFDARNKLCHQIADEVRHFFPQTVFATVIPRNVRLTESPSHGLPVILYDPSCRGAQSYVELAREVTRRDPLSWAAVPQAQGAD